MTSVWSYFDNYIFFKGMVHMITMLTYIAQIDIGEYKNPFKCPETTLVTLPCFGFFLYPRNKRKIPKIMPDDPKNVAWQMSGRISGIPKIVPDNYLPMTLLMSLLGIILGSQKRSQKCCQWYWVEMMDKQKCCLTIAVSRDHWQFIVRPHFWDSQA